MSGWRTSLGCRLLRTRHQRKRQWTNCQLYTDWYVSCRNQTAVSPTRPSNTNVRRWNGHVNRPSSSWSWHSWGGWPSVGCRWSRACMWLACPVSTSPSWCAAWSWSWAARWATWTCSFWRRRCTFAVTQQAHASRSEFTLESSGAVLPD